MVASSYSELDSSTVSTDGVKVIRISRKLKNARKKHSNCSPCKFALFKMQKDTPSAIALIAKMTHTHTNRFTFAGNKDRRAVTTQWVSVDLPPVQLAGINRRLVGIRLGNFQVCDAAVKLGDLSGNRFTLVLRNITATDETVSVAMDSLQHNGFVNYFGTQRFGTTSVPTHHVGIALLRNNYRKAIDLILMPKPGDTQDAETVKARQAWAERGNASECLKLFPPRMVLERQLLQGLVANSKDLRAAFDGIPRMMRIMYVHSYQSYVWNFAASKRIETYGLKPVVGDLVAVNEVPTDAAVDEEQEVLDDGQVGFSSQACPNLFIDRYNGRSRSKCLRRQMT